VCASDVAESDWVLPNQHADHARSPLTDKINEPQHVAENKKGEENKKNNDNKHKNQLHPFYIFDRERRKRRFRLTYDRRKERGKETERLKCREIPAIHGKTIEILERGANPTGRQ
jgi:hypothetical protein